MSNDHSPVYNRSRSKIKHCCCCISPRIEVIVWASLSLSCNAFLIMFMYLGTMLIDALSGASRVEVSKDIQMFIFSLALLVDIVYNILVIVASHGKKVKLLKISMYLGVAMCIVLCAVTAIAYQPSPHLFHELKHFLTFFVVLTIIVRGYMLLLIRGVRLQLKQEHSQHHGYIGLDKTMETRTDHEPPI
ncbi:uncharacterized protein LOC134796864 [Cydia splendana]|uniref:uncharacterized protein LOC134796864 n=1 Tax=Cydia splendana TaxID=1100963 RepID=UPI0028F4BE32